MFTETRTQSTFSAKKRPEWEPGISYSAGEKVLFKGQIFECTVPHVPYSSGWHPETLLYFWVKI